MIKTHLMHARDLLVAQMRNLTTSEIVSQVIHAKRVMNDFPTMEDLETRKQAIVDKRRRMRQEYAQLFRKGDRRHEVEAPPLQIDDPIQEDQEEKTVAEEPRRIVTNIVFMVRHSAGATARPVLSQRAACSVHCS
jgi:hypothetical protein